MPDNLFKKFAFLRQNVRLTPGEHKQIRLNILSACPRSDGSFAPEIRLDAPHLFAYEKALIFDALAEFMQDNPLRTAAVTVRHTPVALWHGHLFRHLQPFVLR